MALTDTQLQNDAIALLTSLKSNGCSQSADADVSTFQQSYNNAGQGPLTVDGLYGANTENGLQNVINANSDNSSLANESAPAGCVGAAPGGASSNPGTYQPGVVLSTGGSGALPYIVGAIVVAGALAAYTYSKHGKRRRRR
jgi:hypothetical protein